MNDTTKTAATVTPPTLIMYGRLIERSAQLAAQKSPTGKLELTAEQKKKKLELDSKTTEEIFEEVNKAISRGNQGMDAIRIYRDKMAAQSRMIQGNPQTYNRAPVKNKPIETISLLGEDIQIETISLLEEVCTSKDATDVVYWTDPIEGTGSAYQITADTVGASASERCEG